MRRTTLAHGWTYKKKANAFLERAGMGAPERAVTLPHDATIAEPRDPAGEANVAFHPDAAYSYRRTLDVPDDWRGRVVELEFEGVYRGARVYVNESYAGQWAYGYSEFGVVIDHLLRFGAPNELRVECHNDADSRWYAGAGLIRPVHLLVGERCHLPRNAVAVTTPEADADGALVAVDVTVVNADAVTRAVRVHVDLVDADGATVASDSRPLTILPGTTEAMRSRLYLADARLWSADHPHLYTARVRLTEGDEELDADAATFGVRTLSLDPKRGLRVNGEPVKLRGACVHHDNGALGGAAIGRAEERRVELLKAAGFNAIRASHQPLSRAMLDACDRLGVYVMDEFTDMWVSSKNDHDYANEFATWWQRDVDAMVAKDRNHPSVILYSIGNEIHEHAHAIDQRWGRAIADRIRALDPTRYVTSAVSGAMASMVQSRVVAQVRAEVESGEIGVNTFMTRFQALLDETLVSEEVGWATEDAFAYLDVAGYNYMPTRYPIDSAQFPHRVIVGSETHPPAIHDYWTRVLAHPHVIGDFTWTGWDYLGEVGVGRVDYPADSRADPGFMAGWPWLTAWTGDLTISGVRRPISYHREVVFGLRAAPAIAVRRPEHHGKATKQGPWAWSDSVDSWSWAGFEGRPVTVEVSADAEEVALVVNGSEVGRAAPKACLATFETTYEPGTVEAIAYRGGAEIGRAALRSATGEAALRLAADREVLTAGPDDLAYVAIELADPDGVVFTTASALVSVTVEGPGVLAGLQSDDPRATESFVAGERTTFDGRALAIVRPTGVGEITVTVTADGHEPRTVTLRAR